MTDREMLEMAAKAAGLKIVADAFEGYGQDIWCGFRVDDDRGRRGEVWNPKDDDGDAFRLAVKLRLTVDLCDIMVGNDGWDGEYAPGASVYDILGRNTVEEVHGADPMAATRRAILRAAAQIGKEMP